ncbi:protein-tyrosine-phosphatase IBR5-like [Asparagus officinalis]|uniref:protein-tyrosine-phosphatase IBR5-like n=1 Tax=Asparagus officinalis TaxID=4686 RepID=UPI00098E1C93|nr:protein-tyrosine-phosphatase IBR5-like [Asparagus officinalis]
MQTVPACQNLYKNSFVYHCLQDDKTLQFDDAIKFLEQCEKEKERVLVHCMSGKNRSPAIVMGYLMKCKGWRLPQSFHWVKDRRPQVELSPAVHEQLVAYEKKVFGSQEAVQIQVQPQPDPVPTFGLGLGFPRPADPSPVPIFNQGTTSIFERTTPNNFTFGAGNEAPMDSSSA